MSLRIVAGIVVAHNMARNLFLAAIRGSGNITQSGLRLGYVWDHLSGSTSCVSSTRCANRAAQVLLDPNRPAGDATDDGRQSLHRRLVGFGTRFGSR
jgi:hypothetical protein